MKYCLSYSESSPNLIAFCLFCCLCLSFSSRNWIKLLNQYLLYFKWAWKQSPESIKEEDIIAENKE